jgi:hypothetical protein
MEFGSNFWIALFTGVLTLVATIQVCVYWMMHKANIVTQRAYVTVHDLTISMLQAGKSPKVSFVVENIGKTPATIQSLHVRREVRERTLPPLRVGPFTNPLPGEARRDARVIHQGYRITHDFDPPETITKDEFDQMRDLTMALWMTIEIVYLDKFDVSHSVTVRARCERQAEGFWHFPSSFMVVDAD